MKKSSSPASIMCITLIARNTSTTLQVGKHVCQIKSVDSAVPVRQMPWSDKTPQLKVQFTKGSNQVLAWYNMLGYMEFDNLTDKQKKSGKYVSMTDPEYGGKAFAVDKATNCRLLDAVFGIKKGKNGEWIETTNAHTLAEYNRLQSEGNELIGGSTFDAQNIIAKLAFDAGMETGEEFSEQDLIGRTVGISVTTNNSGNIRVDRTFAPSSMVATSDVAS